MTKSAVYTGRHWPLSIVAFFIVLALINVVVVYLALHSKSEYLETSPYEKGLAFDRVIEQRLAAKKSGFEPRYEFGAIETDGLREIRLVLGHARKFSKDAIFHLDALRMSDSTLDHSVELHRHGEVYLARAKIATQGLWLFRLTISDGQETLLFESREIVP